MTLPFPQSNVVPLPVGRVRKSKSSPPSTSPRSKIRSTETISDSRSRSENGDSRSRSGSRNGNGRIAATDPREFALPFDLISELTTRREEYKGTEMFTLCFIPSYLRTCLDRVRARVVSADRIGLSVTAAACIDYGLTQVEKHPDIVRILEIRTKLHMLERVDAENLQEVLDWLQAFPISVPNSGGAAAVKRMNISLSEHLRMRLSELSGDLGTSKSALATLAIMHTLSEQPCILPEHEASLRDGVDGFVRRVKIRAGIAEVLVFLFFGSSDTASALATLKRLLAQAGET